MLKISEIRPGKPTVTFRLEGRVVGPWVDELNQVCEPLVRNHVSLTLDLAEVLFADENGVAALTALLGQGARLINATPFVEEQLKAGANSAAE